MDPTLIDTYKRYKRGTFKLIAWLHDSANQSDDTAVSKKNSTRGPITAAPPKRITVEGLVEDARKIAAATDPTIEIPLEILDITKDVIVGRQSCAAWYSALAAEQKGTLAAEFSDANGRHQHFISILEEVFELLRREHKSRRPKRKKKIELATDIDDLSNLYLHLNLEEPSNVDEKESATAHMNKPSPMPDKSKKVEIDDALDENSNEEKLFQVWCHLRDLFELRLQSRRTWQQYAAGELSFFTACEVFDQAVRIATMLSKNFSEEHPDLGKFPQIINLLGEESYVTSARNYDVELAVSEDRSDRELSTSNHAEVLLQPAWCAIYDYGVASVYIRRSSDDSRQLASMFPGHPFGKALLQIAGDLYNVVCIDTVTYEQWEDFHAICDPYTRELQDQMTADDPLSMTTGLLAATQMHMDVHDVLNGDTGRGFLECAPLHQRFHESLQSIGPFYNSRPVAQANICRADNDPLVASQVRPECNDKGEHGWHVKLGLRKGSDSWIWLPINMLSTLPVLAVHITLGRLNCAMSLGSLLCNYAMVVPAAAHLYNAAVVQGSAKRSWPDMDVIVARENELAPFLREADGTVGGAAKQYSMALGVGLTQVAGARRPVLPQSRACSKKAVRMKNLSHFVCSHKGTGANRSTRDLDRAPCFGLHSELDLNTLYDSIKHYSETAGIKDETIKKQFRDTRRLNPGQLLQTLQEIFIVDDVCLHFDFISFHQRCIDLLTDVALRHLTQTAEKRLIPSIKTNQYLYEFVHEILWDAADSERRGLDPMQTTLFSAGHIIDNMTERLGSKNIDVAHEVCSGFIPEGRKPARIYAPNAITQLAKPSSQAVHVQEYFNYYAPHRRFAVSTPPHPKTQGSDGQGSAGMARDIQQDDLELESMICHMAKFHFNNDIAKGVSTDAVLRKIAAWVDVALSRSKITDRRSDVSMDEAGNLQIRVLPMTEGASKETIRIAKCGVNLFIKADLEESISETNRDDTQGPGGNEPGDAEVEVRKYFF